MRGTNGFCRAGARGLGCTKGIDGCSLALLPALLLLVAVPLAGMGASGNPCQHRRPPCAWHARTIVRPGAAPPARPRSAAGGVAHLWVHPLGSGSCVRSAVKVPYDAARRARVFRRRTRRRTRPRMGASFLRGGTYREVQISGGRRSSNRIVFDAPPGETPIFAGGWFELGVQPLKSAVGPDYVTIRGSWVRREPRRRLRRTGTAFASMSAPQTYDWRAFASGTL